MEREQLKLDVPKGMAPLTDTGAWGVVMNYASGKNDKMQWFDYKPSFYAQPVRVEWPLDSMFAVLDGDTAEILINGGYARIMTQEEALDYNTSPGKQPGTISEQDIPQTPHPDRDEEDQGEDPLGENGDDDDTQTGKAKRVPRKRG